MRLRDRAAAVSRPEKACDARGLELVDRDGTFDATGLIPDAEPDVRILVEVARDAQRLPLVAPMRREELDELAAQRRSAPGTEAEPLLDAASALGAGLHRS
jgi:hypothetical protein